MCAGFEVLLVSASCIVLAGNGSVSSSCLWACPLQQFSQSERLQPLGLSIPGPYPWAAGGTALWTHWILCRGTQTRTPFVARHPCSPLQQGVWLGTRDPQASVPAQTLTWVCPSPQDTAVQIVALGHQRGAVYTGTRVCVCLGVLGRSVPLGLWV